jgi:two-component system, NtrC family, response regulator AtoC
MLTPPATVFVVEDEQHLRHSLAELFVSGGYHVIEAADGKEALELLERLSDYPDVMFLDLKMPRLDGMATLQALRGRPETQRIPVVIITSFGGSEQTIRAMKAGAYDYITKPFESEDVLRMAGRAIEVSRLGREVARLRACADTLLGEEETEIIGHHPAMREVFKLIGKIAPSDATVLLTGESGTGKEGIARAIHRHSTRAHRSLVTVNCAAIPDGLLESELFGHERGAFTGAIQSKPGRFELAEAGTIFLDEIGDLSLNLQVKLLRILQERTFERVGGTQSLHVDFRLLAATNRNLQQLISDGRFREDLFYRLNVVRIEVPPLRARKSDIPALAEFFLRRYQKTDRVDSPLGFSDEALRALLLHDYPGNVRELEHLIQRAVLMAQGSLITMDDLSELATGQGSRDDGLGLQELLTLPLDEATRALERILITRALARTSGVKAEAARLLGIHRQALYTKLKELAIEDRDYER